MRLLTALFAALLSLPAALPVAPPAAAETARETIGATEVAYSYADAVAAWPEFDAFLREDAETAARNVAGEGARRVAIVDQAAVRGGRYVSVLRRTEADLGGASPNIQLEALVWDGAAKDLVRLDAFFDAGAPRDEALIAISHHLREAIKADLWAGKVPIEFEPLVMQATNPDAVVLSNFTISSAGILAFHYSPYEVAPYDKGPVSIEVPGHVFAPWLNAAGRAAFQ